MPDQSFPKAEHLKSKKLIEQLFKGASSAKGYPVLAVFTTVEESAVVDQAGFSVSKKKFKRAVDRNLLKRRMREAYRLNKNLLPATTRPKIAVMFVYMPAQICTFAEIEKGMTKALNKIAETLLAADTQS